MYTTFFVSQLSSPSAGLLYGYMVRPIAEGRTGVADLHFVGPFDSVHSKIGINVSCPEICTLIFLLIVSKKVIHLTIVFVKMKLFLPCAYIQYNLDSPNLLGLILRINDCSDNNVFFSKTPL